MSIAEKINTVLEAERRAREILSAAEANAAGLRIEANRLIREAQENARKNAALQIEALRVQSREEGDAAIAEIDRRAETQTASLEETARRELPAAVAFVYERLTGDD